VRNVSKLFYIRQSGKEAVFRNSMRIYYRHEILFFRNGNEFHSQKKLASITKRKDCRFNSNERNHSVLEVILASDVQLYFLFSS
jgi:hypothetical protein